MQNALTIYQKMPDPMAAVQQLGRAIAGSKMFGCDNEFQGQVFALECLTRGTPPLTLQQEYHVMFNGITMKSDTMLAKFHQRGGKSRIITRTPERAVIELSKENDTQQFTFTWEEAQKEDFIYEGKTKELKVAFRAYMAGKGPQPEISDKYFSPRSRMQMLWARVVSDGVRAMMPEVNAARYTPEEMGGEATEAGGDGDAIDAEYEVKQVQQDSAEATGRAPHSNGNGSSHSTTGQTATESADGFASSGQARLIYSLFDELKLSPEQRTAVLTKRKVESPRGLTVDQAAELIDNLQKKLLAVNAAANAAAVTASVEGATSQADPAAISARDNGPATQVQIDKLKTLLQEMEQVAPGTIVKVTERIKATGRVPAEGQKLLSVLTLAEAEQLTAALQRKEMALFFEKSLQPASDAGNHAAEGDSKN